MTWASQNVECTQLTEIGMLVASNQFQKHDGLQCSWKTKKNYCAGLNNPKNTDDPNKPKNPKNPNYPEIIPEYDKPIWLAK